MNQATILAMATSAPGPGYSQDELYERAAPFLGANSHIRAIFTNSGIDCRHMVVDKDYYAVERPTSERNQRYMAEAVPLVADTISRCLEVAGLGPESVDDLFIVSCTGIDTPGLDLRLAGRLGMRPDLRRAGLLGMGCYGALPGLLRAQQAVAGQPGRKALLVAVELCSLHFQPADRSIENVVASALFADGAAAVLVGSLPEGALLSGSVPSGSEQGPSRSSRNPLPRIVDAATYCDYTTFDHMAFHLTDTGFKMRLSAYVPQLLATQVERFLDQLLARNGISQEDIRFWGVHPGSSKILDHLGARLGLAADDLRHSRAVLRDYGNMSSPTVLFVLDDIQRRGDPQAGDYGLLLAFGPGLTMECVLLQW